MTDTITISGYAFTVPSPFAEGHVCTEAEANVLNRAMHANLRRNFAKRVEEMTSLHGPIGDDGNYKAILQRELDEDAAAYRFGGPDPASLEALVIAEQIVRQRLRAQKKVVSDYTKSQLSDMASILLSGPQGAEIRLMARERVKLLHAAAAKELALVLGNGQ